MHIASDTGGTFTDLVDTQGRVLKVLSTPSDPSEAVRAGVAEMVPGGVAELLSHGTTVATNALLERRGAPTALLTTAGFADVIEIARQDRPSLYDPFVDRPEPLVPREWRYEVHERLDANGRVLEALDAASIPALDPEVRSVAVCLLHSDLDHRHEVLARDELARRGLEVSASFEVSPEYREYERTVTTVVNAYLRPLCRDYLRRLDDVAGEVLVMTSSGGLMPAADAAELPAGLLLSGPAGGVSAAAVVAGANGFSDALTFDMGGTSTDVCLIRAGRPEPAAQRSVGGLPLRLPSLDVHTIGAGGGSVAGLDPGGALVVGPQSAGAVPGPACYGRGGTEPTVTDANVVMGRIPVEAVFPDLGRLDRSAAAAALERAGVRADGVLRVVNANMERALRVASVERGVDPRELALVAFGGAGPLHACDLADALGISTVIVPDRAGVFSAVGILGASRQREVVRSWADVRDHRGLEDALASLAEEAVERVSGSGDPGPIEVETALDCRYEGQSHELRVTGVEAFDAEHEARNGYSRPGTPLEVVALRAVARSRQAFPIESLPARARAEVVGPSVLAEEDCTVWVPDGWRGGPGACGALVLRRHR